MLDEDVVEGAGLLYVFVSSFSWVSDLLGRRVLGYEIDVMFRGEMWSAVCFTRNG